ncbi:hypothetical protein GE061_001152 [Apolygus lucorum]|uniref:Homeobox domain-containing protein n=1 Tax=Apolygus lucorum TaxID=248454 RepID=A0A8S9Y686_APOLU|nr:hypothetical protein GE061_001152 [Apolygus lucorum]
MPRTKNLTPMVVDIKEDWDAEHEQSSCLPEETVLPHRIPVSTLSTTISSANCYINPEHEWNVLWSGAEIMYHATNVADRDAGWRNFESAARKLKAHLTEMTNAANAMPSVLEPAMGLGQQHNHACTQGCNPEAVAQHVIAQLRARPRTPPTIDTNDLAQRLRENLTMQQAPASSPIYNLPKIAELVAKRLQARPKAAQPQSPRSEANHAQEVTEVPNTVAAISPQRLSKISDSAEEGLEEATTSNTGRICLACGRARAHNSRLWCEACRTFKSRARKAAAKGIPYICTNPKHKGQPDTTKACKGCRIRQLDEIYATVWFQNRRAKFRKQERIAQQKSTGQGAGTDLNKTELKNKDKPPSPQTPSPQDIKPLNGKLSDELGNNNKWSQLSAGGHKDIGGPFSLLSAAPGYLLSPSHHLHGNKITAGSLPTNHLF